MENLKSSKMVALVSTALMVASVVWLMNTRKVNSSLEAGLEKERLRSEQLLSEKLQLDKEIDKFKEQLFALKDKNLDLDNVVRSLTAKLEEQQKEYNRMKRENLSLAQVKKQRDDLMALRNTLENELTALKISYAALESKNGELNTMIAQLEERNRVLSDDLNRALFAAVDQSGVEALKKSDKLTVRAKRTRKMVATFRVPSTLANLSFRVLDPKGNALTPQYGTIVSNILPAETTFTASSDGTAPGRTQQLVQVEFIPKSKLRTGVYTVEVLNDNLYVSSVKVKLK